MHESGTQRETSSSERW